MDACPACGEGHPPDGECRRSLELRPTLVGNPVARAPRPSPSLPPRGALAPGTRLGEYEIREKIGRGGMGTVYAGVQPVIGKLVAVKVLDPIFRSDETAVERFVREARAVNRIAHRNIVDIFGFGQLPTGDRYCVMELLTGENLDERLAREPPLTYAQSFAILGAVTSALAAAHDEGVVHRDLKPDNIFLARLRSGDRIVKLLDFGIAKLVDAESASALTVDGTVMGTPLYMSPEQCRGEPVGPASDLYALGIIMYELFTGAPPFTEASHAALIEAHLDRRPPPPGERADLPPALAALMLECLEKEPSRRPPSAAAVAERLRDVAAELGLGPLRLTIPPSDGDGPTPTRTPGATDGERRSRTRVVATACYVAILGIIVGGAGWLASRRHAGAVRAAAMATPATERPVAPTAPVATPPASVAPPTGALTVVTNAPHVTFTVDDRVVGDGSGTLRLDGLAAGRHAVTARGDGFERRDETVDVLPGEPVSLTWRLTRVGHARPAPRPPARTAATRPAPPKPAQPAPDWPPLLH